jgi:hypothetical protein
MVDAVEKVAICDFAWFCLTDRSSLRALLGEALRLPVIALRRILSQVAIKKRAAANSAERAAWAADDLLFVSNCGAGDNAR